MSTQGMTLTVLASTLAEAVAKDNDDPDGHDIASGLFGPAVSEWLRDVAKQLAAVAAAAALATPPAPAPTWPEWAEQILKIVREYSGYDGYDDEDGVDLPEEVREALEELTAQIERLEAKAPAPARQEPLTLPAGKEKQMELTGYQVKQINEFMGGDYDCDVTIAELPERTPIDPDTGALGEPLKAGIYIWCTDYPEEGSVLLEHDQAPHPHPQDAAPASSSATRAAITALAASAEPKCHCGDRPAAQCHEPWEPGCDLGNNPAHVRVAAEPVAVPAGWREVIADVAADISDHPSLAHEKLRRLLAAPPAPAAAEQSMIEAVTRAILFADCGHTNDWRSNTDLGIAAIRAYESYPRGVTTLRDLAGSMRMPCPTVATLLSRVDPSQEYADNTVVPEPLCQALKLAMVRVTAERLLSPFLYPDEPALIVSFASNYWRQSGHRT